jgi:hypothetical protein
MTANPDVIGGWGPDYNSRESPDRRRSAPGHRDPKQTVHYTGVPGRRLARAKRFWVGQASRADEPTSAAFLSDRLMSSLPH